MWEVLEVTHEGTTDVKRARKHTLIQEYEMFRMLPGETVSDVQKRFTHIINHLIGLGKVFEKEELNIKVLKCLDRSWQPKVTAISESKDLSTMSIAALFGKLREHELELNRLAEQEDNDKKKKGLALKTLVHKEEISEDEGHGGSDAENLNLLVRKFNKFLKYKNKNYKNKRYNKKSDLASSNFTCFGCGKQGHIKAECPYSQNKERNGKKKHEKSFKTKKAYIAWDENDISSSDSSSDDERANLCLMADCDTASSVFLKAKKSLWYLDSGCSRHMCGDKRKFVKLTLKNGGFVTYGDNNKGKILGSGDVEK